MNETGRELMTLIGIVDIQVDEIAAQTVFEQLGDFEQSTFEQRLKQRAHEFHQRVLRLPLLLIRTSHEPTWRYTTDNTTPRTHAYDPRNSTTK